MTTFLQNTVFEDTKYTVKHMGKSIQINIYEDDTVKDILIKFAVISKQKVTSDHIYAWIGEGTQVESISFNYPNHKLTNPIKDKGIDNSFIDKDGNRLLVPLESTIHKIMENFNSKTIHFITLIDYLNFLKLSHKNKITEEECKQKTKFTKNELFYGKIKKYWPRLKEPIEFFEYNSPPLVSERNKKIKIESKIYQLQKDQLEYAYKLKDPIYPKDYRIYTYCVHNYQEDTTVHLFQLFNDISLGKWHDTLLTFSKLTLENNTDTCCKLWKDSIYYNTEDTNKYISKELFIKWFYNPVISIPNTNPRYMDQRNSISFKLHKDRITVTIIVFSNGHVKLMFNDISKLNLTQELINEKISLANKFITHINNKKIYTEKKLSLIQSSDKSFDICSLKLIYPIKNYKIDKMIKLLSNLSTFVRFNKEHNTLISCIYKRVSDYDSIESKLRVISLLHNSKRGLSRDGIIKEITKIFNIGEEEANDEYDQWVHLSDGGKVFQKDENGIEFIIDLVGTNIKVDVSSLHSYSELVRFYNFMNFVMKVYDDYIEKNKDPYKLFGKTEIDPLSIQLQDESEINMILEQGSPVEESLAEESLAEESVLSEKTSDDELVSSVLSSNRSIRLEDFSSQSESSDSGMGLLEDSESEGGGKLIGGNKPMIQIGGYNVHRYYLNRLIEYDKKSPYYVDERNAVNLFSGYSVKQRKSSKNKDGSQGYTFATKCTPNNQRQPIAVSKEDLDLFNKEGVGEGEGYREALNIPNRDPDTYYICPKYWNVKDEKPMKPEDYESFKDNIINNKSSTAQKKNTDKFILVRDHNYWSKAGDNVNNYRLELWDNFHPSGYKIPCCFSRVDIPDIDWYVMVKDPNDDMWKNGQIKKIIAFIDKQGEKERIEITKKGTITEGGKKVLKTKYKKYYNDFLYEISVTDQIYTCTVKASRLKPSKKGAEIITKQFPCNPGMKGFIHPLIQNYLYPTNLPKIKGLPDMQLYRVGIKRGTPKRDQTFLESILVIAKEVNPLLDVDITLDKFIQLILKDLHNLRNKHEYISSIGGGTFINLFKKDINDLVSSDIAQFKYYMKKNMKDSHNSIIKKHLSKIDSKETLINMLSRYSTSKEGIFINREFTEILSIIQFERYLTYPNEIILDTYLVPVLVAISKFKSNIFGEVIPNLSIVVFEGTSEDVKITQPMGGYEKGTTNVILIYKERGNLYEPILYVEGAYKEGILVKDLYSKEDPLMDYKRKWKNYIVDQCITKIKEFNTYVDKDILTIDQVSRVLEKHNLPILGYIYDNYNKIVLVETKLNIYIPVSPTRVIFSKPCKYIGDIKKSKYSNCIKVLELIDKEKIGPSYLDNASITVIGISDRKNNLQLRINELVFQNGSYIPLKKEPYTTVHKLPVIGNISYFDVDKTLALYGIPKDECIEYNQLKDFKERIRNIFFQKAYLYIRENQQLLTKLLKIKHHEIMLNYHKRIKLYNLLEKPLQTFITMKGSYSDKYSIEDSDKLNIPTINNISSEDFYYKIVRLFIDLLLNYSEKDYENFLQVSMDYSKLSKGIKDGEYFIKQSDILNESYLQYFVRYSEFIRNVGVYNGELSRSKLVQLNNLKQKNKESLKKTKQFPEILYTLFGRGIIVQKEEQSDIEIISTILNRVDSVTREVNPLIIESLLNIENKDNYRIDIDDLNILSKEFNIGFCLVTKQFTRKIYHDIHIAINIHSFIGDIKESEIILLYQDTMFLYHIIKKDKTSVLVKEITSKLFQKKLKENNLC